MKISDARFFKSPPIFENSILKALGGVPTKDNTVKLFWYSRFILLSIAKKNNDVSK